MDPRAVLCLLVVNASGCLQTIGGAFDPHPSEMTAALSPGARRLLRYALAPADKGPLLDYHTHLIALDERRTGGFVNRAMRSWWSPLQRLRFELYASAAGVTDLTRADAQYVDRLVQLSRAVPGSGRRLLLAFDRYHHPNGSADRSRSAFYVPNAYAVAVARRYPDVLVPAISVHPYRVDAVRELRRWAAEGVRIVKWLPNAMGIDPASGRCDAFYRAMVALDMVLLTHGGRERAVNAAGGQRLGNPLRLRRPLQMGLTIIVAHSAADGTSIDLDDPRRARRDNLALFFRLLDERRFRGQLYGEISAITLFNRVDKLQRLLRRRDVHDRLVNGSDYPIPAINALVHLHAFSAARLLTRSQVRHLKEIYRYNPLLFDLALKRSLRSPRTGHGFAPAVFRQHPALAPQLRVRAGAARNRVQP